MEDIGHSVSIWIDAAKHGDAVAAQNLFERYFQRLISVSKSKVRRDERFEDGEDAAISTMYAYLNGCTEGKFPNIQDRDSLWPLLVTMVVNYSKKQIRSQMTQKRGEGLLRGESVFGDAGDGSGLAEWAVADDYVASGLEAVVKEFRAGLDSLEQQIFDQMLLQQSGRSIAKALSRPPRTIIRKINEINHRLAAMLEDFDAGNMTL